MAGATTRCSLSDRSRFAFPPLRQSPGVPSTAPSSACFLETSCDCHAAARIGCLGLLLPAHLQGAPRDLDGQPKGKGGRGRKKYIEIEDAEAQQPEERTRGIAMRLSARLPNNTAIERGTPLSTWVAASEK